MQRRSVSKLVFFLTLILVTLLPPHFAFGQNARGALAGRVVDSAGAVLPGARVELQPGGLVTASGPDGEFNLSGLAPGNYTVTVHYLGFAPFSSEATVTGGQVARVDATLKVASKNEEIMVYAERVHGEAEAVNRQRESDNILQVLPVDVITSLPNTNIADAVGRLPSVTLERDEGEGKYVQIRGAEPEWNNVTINGMSVASPEGVRQIKLDIIPANLVESVEINKTLSANQDGDAIGGSVNLTTKSAAEKPTFYVNGIGGYTPIIGGRSLSEFDGTVGQRFGANKKLGILFGASYDWNGRGINDVEPVPTAMGSCGGGQCTDFSADSTAAPPYFTTYNTEDIREYRYYRTRYGFTGNVDYKLGDVSGIYVRFLYSHFDNFGDRWVWTPTVGTFATPTSTNADGNMSSNAQIRRPVQVIGSLQAGGKHAFGQWLLLYELTASRSSSEDHGYSTASFNGTGLAFNQGGNPSLQFAIDPNGHTPRIFSQGVNLFDPTQYTLQNLDVGQTYGPQLNLEAAFSAARNYNLGGHFGTFEFGAKVRNAHKFEDALDPVYDSNNNPTMDTFLGTFSNSGYYDGRYPGAYNGRVVDYGKVRSYFNQNGGAFSLDPASSAQNQYPNNYDLIEKVSAGYLMNTLQFGRVRLQTGVRFEGTDESLLGYRVSFDSNGFLCPGPTAPDPNCQGVTNPISTVTRNPSYLDVLPSAQVKFGLGTDSAIRASYGRGISRPNFADLPPFFNNQDGSTRIKIGNPDLKPAHANNFDLLFEQYLKPLGVIQGGFFYKQISDPIYEDVDSAITNSAFGSQYNSQSNGGVVWTLRQPINGKSANIYGIEIAYQQHLTFLPGFLSGFGLAANYGYAHSSTDGVPLRTDKPALQRQAPNTFNFSPTYDRARLSARLGLSYNGANIFAYNYKNLNADGSSSPQPLGIKGPFGDNYLYQHTQVDVQTSFRMYRGLQFIFAGLNLTNEAFGFYQGSGIYPIQREYYKPSYEFGLRYSFAGER